MCYIAAMKQPLIKLGQAIMSPTELADVDLRHGVIDKSGDLYDIGDIGTTLHSQMANYLCTEGKIKNDWIRVESGSVHPGTFEAETMDNTPATFLLNDPMARAMYNGIQSRNKFGQCFEKKLAYFGGGLGFISTGFRHVGAEGRLYNRELLDANLKKLHNVVGKENFNPEFFMEVLNQEEAYLPVW